MIRMCMVAMAALMLAAPAVGDEALLAKYRRAADACWTNVEGGVAQAETCQSLVFEACSYGEPGGQSNQGMSQCLHADAAFWDEKLNEIWGQVMPLARAADTADLDHAPGFAVRAQKLREAQRAWIAFRDAQCAFDYAVFGDGSMRLLFYPDCVSERTFDRVMDLLSIKGMFEG